MKRISFPLLVGVLMTSIFITGCSTARDSALTSQQLTTGRGADQTLSSDFGSVEPQLEPFDRALEESRKQFEMRLAQESEPQLEPFDRAFEESKKEFDLKLAQEKEKIEGAFTLAKERGKE